MNTNKERVIALPQTPKATIGANGESPTYDALYSGKWRKHPSLQNQKRTANV